MRTLYLLVACAILYLTAGCASAPVDRPVEYGEEDAVVTLKLVGAVYSVGTYVRFSTRSTAYTHFVQEITLDSGEVLIECFRDDGDILDRHTWADRPHSRAMIVYCANCVGVDEWGGFGHLPSNGAGRYTTVGHNFNEDYWQDHEATGYIRDRAKSQIEWAIVDDGATVRVYLNGAEIKP